MRCTTRRWLWFTIAFAACATPAPAPVPVNPADPASAPVAAAAADTPVAEILRGSRLPEPLPVPLPNDPMGVTIHRLDNGLTVYISTDREQPRVSAWIAVRAGSRHDPADSTGLAHYLEHMLFKGSDQLGTIDAKAERVHLEKIEALYAQLFAEKDPAKRIALLAEIDKETQASTKFSVPSELDRIYASLGSRGLNAFTAPESTVYVIDIPSNRLEHWARLDGERLLRPTFRLFLPELEIVYEEKNRSLDSPERRVYEARMAALYPAHPYGSQLGIGTTEHLKNPAYRHMVDFYKRWYVPNNVAIVLAGDVDAATALPLIRAHFGDWKPQPLPPLPPGQLAAQRGRAVTEIVAEGEESVSLAWHTVPALHDDAIAVEVMDMIVDNAQSGLFNTELVIAQKVLRAGSSPDLRNEAGSWSASASARKGQALDEVERLLLGSIAHLKQGKFSEEDVAAIVLNAEINEKRGLESNGARTQRMATAFTAGEPWPRAVTRLERMRKVTKADVVRVANRYLGPDYVVIRRKNGKFSPPKIAKPAITPVQVDPTRRSPFARALDELPVRPLEPEWLVEGKHYERGKLPAGKLLAARNPRNDLFSLAYDFELGSRRRPLLCHALELQKRAGAGELPAEALQKRLFALGASIRTTCTPDAVNVQVDGIDQHMEATLALLDAWFRRARFDDADVSKLLTTALTQRKNALDDPRQNANALGQYVLRGKDSMYLLGPSNEALARARGAELGKLLAGLPDHQHKTRYFGPRSLADAAKLVRFGGERPTAVAQRPPVRYRRAPRDTIYLLPREMAQAQVVLALPGPPPAKKDRAVSRLLSEYLAGGSGVVPYEIRETRGLAYSAVAFHTWGARPNDEAALTGYMATQPDKTSQAIGRLVEIMRKLPIDTARVGEAKRAIDEDHRATRATPRTVTALVDAWDEQGEPRDPRPRLRAEVAALEPAALHAYLLRLSKTPALTAVTGEKARLDLDELGKLGRIEEVAVDSLYNFGKFPAEPPAVASKP